MKSFPERLALATGLLLSPAWGFVWPDCSKPPLSNVAVCNTALSPADRAAALVAALNITEKLNQLVEYVPIKVVLRPPLTVSLALPLVQRDLGFRPTSGGTRPCTASPRLPG